MAEDWEGNGYLFDDGHLVTTVRYRLRRSVDEWARTVVEGELQPRGRRILANGVRYMLVTQAGFSLPLEVSPESTSTGWCGFRRIRRGEEPMRWDEQSWKQHCARCEAPW